jgi:hypothetical protein
MKHLGFSRANGENATRRGSGAKKKKNGFDRIRSRAFCDSVIGRISQAPAEGQ